MSHTLPTKHLALFLLSLAAGVPFVPSVASADASAYACQGPKKGPVRAIRAPDSNACAGYLVQAPNGKGWHAVGFDFPGSGKLIASQDGRTVVMIQSYLYGRIGKGRSVAAFDGITDEKNPGAVYIYRDGKRIATHRILDLLGPRRPVPSSTSHVRWLLRAPDPITAKTFSITTWSFRTITFSTETGRIVRDDDAEEWRRCDLIASGQIDLAKKQLSKVFSWKTGDHPKSPIAFDIGPGVVLTHKASVTACLERRGTNLLLTETL